MYTETERQVTGRWAGGGRARRDEARRAGDGSKRQATGQAVRGRVLTKECGGRLVALSTVPLSRRDQSTIERTYDGPRHRYAVTLIRYRALGPASQPQQTPANWHAS